MRFRSTIAAFAIPFLVVGQVVDPQSFFDRVEQHHPVALQAKLAFDITQAEVMAARAVFDPTAQGSIKEKTFEGKNYYRDAQAQLAIPTWLGPSVEVNYWDATGPQLNPEKFVPEGGLLGVGVSWELDRIFADERRAAVRQARALRDAGEAERNLALLELRLRAWDAYVNWSASQAQLELYSGAANNARIRLEAVRTEAANGFRPDIDTTEARIQWINQVLALQEAQLRNGLMVQEINTFLWEEGAVPLVLDSGAVPLLPYALAPEVLAGDSLQLALQFQASHPELVVLANNLEAAQWETQWRRAELLPDVEAGMQWLNGAQGLDQNNWGIASNLWSVKVKIPLFLRKERAAFQKAKIKQEMIELKQIETQRKLEIKLNQAFLETNTAYSQYTRLIENRDLLLQLFEAEQRVFGMGESSLFLLNSRENSYLQAGNKALDQWVKYRKAQVKWSLAMGLPPRM